MKMNSRFIASLSAFIIALTLCYFQVCANSDNNSIDDTKTSFDLLEIVQRWPRVGHLLAMKIKDEKCRMVMVQMRDDLASQSKSANVQVPTREMTQKVLCQTNRECLRQTVQSILGMARNPNEGAMVSEMITGYFSKLNLNLDQVEPFMMERIDQVCASLEISTTTNDHSSNNEEREESNSNVPRSDL